MGGHNKADPWVITKFTAALNQSNLRKIDLTGNTQLGDTFLTLFLANLRAPHLRELALSVLGLTPAAQQPLLAFLAAAGPGARPLKVLCLNGNALNRGFVDGLLATLAAAHNFSLVHVEVYSNRLNDLPSPEPETETEAAGVGARASTPAPTPVVLPSSLHYPPFIPPSPPAAHSSDSSPTSQATLPQPQPLPPLPSPPPTWEEADRLLRALFQRNRLYATITSRQAVRLLSYARALFLRTSGGPTPENSQELLADTGSDGATTTTTTTATILILPAELQIAILHHLVPVLSQAQCHRVCRYVSYLSHLIPSYLLQPSTPLRFRYVGALYATNFFQFILILILFISFVLMCVKSEHTHRQRTAPQFRNSCSPP